MKTKTFKWMLTGALMVSLGMSFSACSNDDEKDDNQQIGYSDPFDKSTEAGIACFNLLSQLSVVGDSLPDNRKTQRFTTLEGRALDESQPFVRSIAVDDMDAALAYYNELTGKELTTAQADTWKMDDIGTLTFNPLNQTDCFATIDVSVKQLPDLTQLRLVPQAAIPENAATFQGDPYYRLGDVVKDKDGSYWICVRPCYAPSTIQSWWVSFNITPACMLNKAETGLQRQYVPYNLGNKKLANGYAAQLLAVLTRSSEYVQKYGTNAFGKKDTGLSDLPRDAMPNDGILQVAANWNNKNIWNMVKPSGMNASDFMAYFRQDLTLIVNSAQVLKGNPDMKIDLAQFTGAGDFYRNTQKNVVASIDMQRYSFDISTYANRGTGNNAAVGNKALVMRFKDGKGLAVNGRNYENQSPTERIEGTTDIYRFAAK